MGSDFQELWAMPHPSSPRWAREPGSRAPSRACRSNAHTRTRPRFQPSLATIGWGCCLLRATCTMSLSPVSPQSYLHDVTVPRIVAASPSLARGVPPALALSALHVKGKWSPRVRML